MTGRFTIVAIPTSAILVIAAATAALIALWLPLNDFPAIYSYQRVPNLLYTYASGSATASCSALARSNSAFEYTCRGGSSALPTGTMTASIDPRSLTLPFYLTSYEGRSTLVPQVAYGYQYPPVQTSIDTITVGTFVTTSTTVRTATATARATRSAYTDEGSRASATSYLSGAAISEIAFAPTSTTYNVHIPHPKYPTRVLMTVYCSIALVISVLVLIQSMINLFIALRLNDCPDTEAKSSSPQPEKDVESRFIFSIRSSEDEDMQVGQATSKPQSKLLKAWNTVPPYGVGGAWIFITVPCLIIGIISMAIQGTNLKDLPAFLAAGACGKKTISYSTWERLICSGQRPSRLPGILTPSSTNRPTNMLTYGWPLTVSLAMFVIIWIFLLILFVSVAVRLNVSRSITVSTILGPTPKKPSVGFNSGRRGLTTSNGAGAVPYFSFAGFSDGGGGGGYGGGGGFGGGGGGCGGGGGDGGGGGGGGCC